MILDNVTASFQADSINPVESYVGNIKPGETGNVDTMLTGIAPTSDDGTIRVSISYEDENGVAAEPVEKEFTLMITEEMEMDMSMDAAADVMDMEEPPSFWKKYGLWLGLLGVAAATAAAVIFLRRRRQKKQAEQEAKEAEDLDNEIS